MPRQSLPQQPCPKAQVGANHLTLGWFVEKYRKPFVFHIDMFQQNYKHWFCLRACHAWKALNLPMKQKSGHQWAAVCSGCRSFSKKLSWISWIYDAYPSCSFIFSKQNPGISLLKPPIVVRALRSAQFARWSLDQRLKPRTPKTPCRPRLKSLEGPAVSWGGVLAKVPRHPSKGSAGHDKGNCPEAQGDGDAKWGKNYNFNFMSLKKMNIVLFLK